MKILQTIQKNHAIMGICSHPTQASNRKYKLIISLFVFGLTVSTIYIWHDANTFLEYSFSMYITTALAMITVIYAIAVFNMSKLFDLISGCQKLFEQKSELTLRSKALYDRTNQQVEIWSKIGYIFMTKVTPVCLICPKAALSYYTYYFTNIGSEAFELPLLFWFPYDWKNPTGYLFTVALQFVGAVYIFNLTAGVIFVGIGLFLFTDAGTKDMKMNLKSINERGVMAENLTWTLAEIAEIIQYHSVWKQLISVFVDIYQPMIMAVCTWSLGTICGVMLLIQIQLHEFISFEMLLLTIFFACYAFGVVLIICELGQRLTDAFEDINDEINQFDWYLFPPQIQRMLPIIMKGTQKEVELECFGSISVTRETFKKVIKSGISYFMVMRQFM